MIEKMKQALEAFEIAAEGGGVNFHAYAEELRQAIAEFDSHTLYREGYVNGYREGYVNGYAFGEAAGKRQAIAELESQEPVALQMDVIVVNLVREGINKHRARELAEHFIKHTHPLQPAKPIPCANHCEAKAFEIVIKNLQGEIESLKAPQSTEQEPVAMYREKCADGKRCLHGCHTNEPCYTHPPQRTEQEPVIDKSAAIRIATALGWEPKREWVGLTDEDDIDWEEGGNLKDLVKAIEAKLKDKNT